MKFTKMHGASNDFIVIDARHTFMDTSAVFLQNLCHRQRGIGADQILLIENSTIADFKYRIFNADGQEVENCGNGARCFALYVYARGLTQKTKINVEIAKGIITLHVLPNPDHDSSFSTNPQAKNPYLIEVDMGVPSFSPQTLPFLTDFSTQIDEFTYQLNTKNANNIQENMPAFGVVSMGNPHAVFIENVMNQSALHERAGILQQHAAFPQSVNVGMMVVQSPNHVQLRVFERGSGETLACGTGACAAVAYGIAKGLLNHHVKVEMQGGVLWIEWNTLTSPLKMRGDAQFVFDGEW